MLSSGLRRDSPTRFHQHPTYQNEKHATDGKERQVIDRVIRNLPYVMDGENLMVNDAFDEIEQSPTQNTLPNKRLKRRE